MSRARDTANYKDKFASGTKMIFNQTAAPTGWTKVTSANDVALRLVSGTVGTGGSVAFETAFASVTPTASGGAVDNHTLTTAQMPSHGHGMSFYTVAGSGGTHSQRLTNAGTGYYDSSLNNIGSISNTGSSNAHNHGMTQPTISAINLDVSYVDVIIATKD